MKEHILVTGGAGFIGSNLAESLVNQGYEVTVLDNLVAGSLENIKTFQDKENFKLVKGDVADRDLVDKVTQGVDAIFHLAARIHVDESRSKTLEYFETNVKGTVNILDMALKNNVKKVIFASSSEVYGTCIHSPMDENHPLMPRSPYAASKVAADRICFAYYNTFGQDVTIVRNFNVFGPRQRSTSSGGVVAIFTDRVMNGLPPKIFGDGTQSRDYMYVEDAVQAYNLVFSKNKLKGEAFNFGTGRDISLNEIAEKVIEFCGKTGLNPEHTVGRPGEVQKFCADYSKANKTLGFKPKYTFEEGLKKYIEWFKNRSVTK